MLAEGLHLRRQFRIEPVRMRHGRLQVVDHQRLGHAAEMPKGVFQRSQKIIGRLPERRFAVAFATVTQHDAKHVRLAPLAVGTDDRRAAAEVDLRFFAGGALHPPKRQRAHLPQASQITPHAVVADGRAVSGQVLIDPLRR